MIFPIVRTAHFPNNSRNGDSLLPTKLKLIRRDPRLDAQAVFAPDWASTQVSVGESVEAAPSPLADEPRVAFLCLKFDFPKI